MQRSRFQTLADKYRDLQIALVGDFCLDRYLEIDPNKPETSIETGLAVHNVVRVRAQPGGAGTILNNLLALGVGGIHVVGFCGDDGEGYELRRSLAAHRQVQLDHFITTPERNTFTYCKPLLISVDAPPRELNRLDTKNWSATPHALENQLIAGLHALVPQVDAVIVLDQVDSENTGVVTQRLRAKLNEISMQYPQLRIVADSRRGLQDWPPVTMKMNAIELARCTGAEPQAELTTIATLAKQLAAARQRDVIVTLSERGLLGADPNGHVEHVPALPVRGPIDIVGAGDAVTANLTAALAAGASLRESLELAAIASSLVIHQLGTTGTASPDEIITFCDDLPLTSELSP